jgi:hypothetical protein
MNILYIVVAVVLLAFIIYQGRSILPRVFSYLGRGKRRFYFEDDLGGTDEAARREQIRPTLEKMEALGFKQLGIMLEKQPLWGKATREIALANPAEKIFASLGFRRSQPSYFFYTPFTSGQVVITAYNSFRFYHSDTFSSSLVSSGEPAEMLEEHKKIVREFMDKGAAPYQEYTRESLIEATNLYYAAPHTRDQLRAAASMSLFFWVICIMIFILFARGAFGG